MDLGEILSDYEQGDLRGRPPYHPAMRVKLLIYGYCVGKMSSRKIKEATYDDVAISGDSMQSTTGSRQHSGVSEATFGRVSEVVRASG
jgi:transposase